MSIPQLLGVVSDNGDVKVVTVSQSAFIIPKVEAGSVFRVEQNTLAVKIRLVHQTRNLLKEVAKVASLDNTGFTAYKRFGRNGLDVSDVRNGDGNV